MNIYIKCIFLLLSLKLDEIRGVPNEDAAYWRKVNDKELQRALRHTPNKNKAKNVILFIGDGMSLPTLTAGRIFKNQRLAEKRGNEGPVGEETPLTFETFPNVGLSRVYNTDEQIPDSASTASAIATGVKTMYGTMGFDNSVKRGSGESQVKATKVESILKWAQDVGMDTGLVTNTRVTHATPGAFYANTAERNWECDSAIPVEQEGDFYDIAKQAVYNDPGRRLKLLMGGGRKAWVNNPSPSKMSKRPENEFECSRKDNENLIQKFLKKNEEVSGFENQKGRYIKDYAELSKAMNEMNSYDYLLGLFSDSLMQLDSEINKRSLEREPDIVEMTEFAVKFLSKNESSNGFFLMIEGGMIDKSHHYGEANNALQETMMLDNAIEKTLELVDTEDTLIIVTSDHGHTMSYSGYTKRGGDIRGFGGEGNDEKKYNLLSYANGIGFNNHYSVTNGKIERKTVKLEESIKPNYIQPSTIATDSEYHSGADVGIFAIGPWSHLIHSVHEQSYINTVMAYSACLGDYTKEPHCNKCNQVSMSIRVLLFFYLMSQLLK